MSPSDPLSRRLLSFFRSILDPGSWLHLLRLLHFYSYSHVRERRKLHLGAGVQIAPNVSFRNANRIEIGDGSRVGERTYLWAGDSGGRIVIGRDFLGAPDVFITASNYSMVSGTRVMDQPKLERDVLIGDDVWLGARVVVVAGVTIGAGCVVGAGSVVTRSLPPGSIAVGAPARVVGERVDQVDGA